MQTIFGTLKHSNPKHHRRVGRKMILAALLINAFSCAVVRGQWHATGGTGANLVVVKPAGESNTMNYYVAGCVNQPEAAFEFMVNDLDGGVTYVNYHATRGCNMKTIADQVIADAKERKYTKVRVIGISVGDYVGRWAEQELDNVETIAINPEPSAILLQPWAKTASFWGGHAANVVSYGLGWISLIPFYPTVGGRFSLAFIAEQFCEIGSVNDAPHAVEHTLGVINSTDDQFLDNEEIEGYFYEVPVEYAESDHGNTVDKAAEYIGAWSALREKIGL